MPGRASSVARPAAAIDRCPARDSARDSARQGATIQVPRLGIGIAPPAFRRAACAVVGRAGSARRSEASGARAGAQAGRGQQSLGGRVVKVKASVRKMCNSCQIVRRKGKVRVICKADPKHKQVQG